MIDLIGGADPETDCEWQFGLSSQRFQHLGQLWCQFFTDAGCPGHRDAIHKSGRLLKNSCRTVRWRRRGDQLNQVKMLRGHQGRK